MRILELFSGSGSLGQAFAQHGWEVTSLDSDVKTDAQIKTDILTWDYSVYPPGFSKLFGHPRAVRNTAVRERAPQPLGT